MAIITDVPTEFGVYQAQYVRVEWVNANKQEFNFEIGIYRTQQEASEGFPPHRSEILRGNTDLTSSDNLWQQAYAIVKQKFTSYTDV